MIKSRDIRDALADLVKVKAKLPLKVFFNHVNNSADDYCWIKLVPARRDEGFGRFQRKIRVIMQVVIAPVGGEVKHTDLYDIVDALDEATCGYIEIGDRFITIYDTEARIFDDILTYEFLLDFTDCIDTASDAERYELMRELQLVVNKSDTWSVKDE